jgi:4-amino-4-deoxy-L-arabinose transferase
MGIQLRLPLILVVGFLVLYVVPLGVRPLVAPDETRYGEIPREMLASGDWIVPRLNGLRYFEKPPLVYWLNATAIRLFGENEFAIRLPSALAVGFTAILLFIWVRRFSDDPATPLFATVAFLLSFEVLAVGTFCVLDSMLSLWVTAAILAVFFACRTQETRTKTLLLVLAGIACGLAFLTKGFLALVLPVLVIVPFAVWQGQLKRFLKMAWVPLISTVLVALPWGILIHRREPDFWHYFFWVEHVDRFLSPHNGQHSGPFWFYVPILLGGVMPWTPLLGPIVQGFRQINRTDPTVRLAICWLVFPFLFFSVCGGKLGTYILPCYPPLAFLIAVGALQCLRGGDAKGFVIGARVLVGLAGLSLVGLLVALIAVPELTESVALWKWAVMAAGLLLWATLSQAATVSMDIRRRLLLYCAGPVLFMFSWPFVSPAAVTARKMPGAFLLSNAARIPADSVLVTDNALTASVCWYYRRADAFITGNTGEYSYGLACEGERRRYVDTGQLARLIAENVPGKCTVLITREDLYRQEYQPLLPQPACEDVRQGVVLALFGSPRGNGDRLESDSTEPQTLRPQSTTNGLY